jgi:peptidoglycan/LPS O-acetylase OafA/YrhL
MFLYADRIPIRPTLVLGSVVLLAIGATTADYRPVAAPALAYLLMYIGIRTGSHRRLVVTTDLSYGSYLFGFPAQQALVLHGLGTLGWAGFFGASVLAVLPLAAASWFLGERPALRFRSGSRRVAATTPTRHSSGSSAGVSRQK